MSGISQCPVCGDLFYGDERDDHQTCRCQTEGEQSVREQSVRECIDQLLAELRASDARVIEAQITISDSLKARKRLVKEIKSLMKKEAS